MKKIKGSFLLILIIYITLFGLTNGVRIDVTTEKMMKLDNRERKIKIKEKYIDSIYFEVKKMFNDTINIDTLFSNKYDSLGSLILNLQHIPIINPVSNLDSYGISCKYGWRQHPIKDTPIFHEGIDITGDYGTEIRATANGVVIMTIYNNDGYGKKIIIDHGNGYQTLYAHLKCINVIIGDTVKRYDCIGEMGNSGLSTGTHLHY